MTTAARRFFSGETEAQAVLEAAGCFGLAPGELAYRQVEKKHGFLRRPKVVIEVDPASPRRLESAGTAAAPAASAGRAPGPPPRMAASTPPNTATRGAGAEHPATPHDGQDRVAAARPHPLAPPSAAGGAAGAPLPLDPPASGLPGALAAAQAVAALAGLRLEARGEVASGEDGEELRIELAGGDRGLLVARQGELLRRCEYLVRRMVRELPPGGLQLDSGGFREEREQTLRRRAAAAAEEVRRSGEPVRFEPLPAAERRILHLVIQEEPAVRSASEGEGELRSVCVFPGAELSPAGSTA